MAMVDLGSAWVPGWAVWAVGPSANRALALRCWSRVGAAYEGLDASLDGVTVHSDQDAVHTSYAWLRRVLIDSEARVSYSEKGARGNPWIESFWARFKQKNASLISEAASLAELQEVVGRQMR